MSTELYVYFIDFYYTKTDLFLKYQTIDIKLIKMRKQVDKSKTSPWRCG